MPDYRYELRRAGEEAIESPKLVVLEANLPCASRKE